MLLTKCITFNSVQVHLTLLVILPKKRLTVVQLKLMRILLTPFVPVVCWRYDAIRTSWVWNTHGRNISLLFCWSIYICSNVWLWSCVLCDDVLKITPIMIWMSILSVVSLTKVVFNYFTFFPVFFTPEVSLTLFIYSL